MNIQSPLGMHDVLPEEVPLWKVVERAVHETCRLYGYSEIRTPMFESTNLFVRSVGEVTDIVEKEMYTFAGDEETATASITLRPELTASIMRAYLQHNLHRQRTFRKLYSLGALFRRERPQKGRFRQFHQLDVEAIGSVSPMLDAETVLMAAAFLRSLGLKDYKIQVNSIGCPECRPIYREVLKKELAGSIDRLCINCVSRYDRNVFRILDCKNPVCREISANVSPSRQHLCEKCAKHFNEFVDALTSVEIVFDIDNRLVRGFDYYTKTIYEFTYPSALGSQDAILGGGRYDNLMKDLGGPELGAVGFAIGIERVLIALSSKRLDEKVSAISSNEPSFYVASVTDSLQVSREVFKLVNFLRDNKLAADMDFEGRSIGAQFKSAIKLNKKLALFLGPDEIDKKELNIKNIDKVLESRIGFNNLRNALRLHDSGVSAHKEGYERRAIDEYEKVEIVFKNIGVKDNRILSVFHLNYAISCRNLYLEKRKKSYLEKALRNVNKSVSFNPEYALAWFVYSTIDILLGDYDRDQRNRLAHGKNDITVDRNEVSSSKRLDYYNRADESLEKVLVLTSAVKEWVKQETNRKDYFRDDVVSRFSRTKVLFQLDTEKTK